MSNADRSKVNISRREALKAIAAGAVVASEATSLVAAAAAPTSDATPHGDARKAAAVGGPYNILFILTDQERFFRPGELPGDYRLPAHERLAKKGIVFENHQINSCVCTPSRSVLYTGRHIQHTKMFDNTRS